MVLNSHTPRSWATIGTKQMGRMSHTPPQRTRRLHRSNSPTRVNVQDCPLLVHARTSSAGAICHAVCPVRAHTHHVPVTPRPDTPAVGPKTPDKTVEASLNPSLSLHSHSALSSFSLLLSRAGLISPLPHHRSPPSATRSSIPSMSIFLSSFSTFPQARLIHSSVGMAPHGCPPLLAA